MGASGNLYMLDSGADGDGYASDTLYYDLSETLDNSSYIQTHLTKLPHGETICPAVVPCRRMLPSPTGSVTADELTNTTGGYQFRMYQG